MFGRSTDSLLLVVAAMVGCSGSNETASSSTSAPATATAPAAPGRPLPAVASWAPLPASPPFLVAGVASDTHRRCAVARDGRVACWGAIQGRGLTREGSPTPQLLVGAHDAVDVVLSADAICLAQRMGPGGCVGIEEAARYRFASPPAELVQRPSQFCARGRDGTIACADVGGDTFTRVDGITDATSLSCNAVTCCATTAAGGVLCWGDAEEELGISASPAPRVPSVKLPPATQIAHLGSSGACVRTTAGAAHCWGAAAALSRPSGVRAVTMSEDVCVVGDDGSLACATQQPATRTGIADVRDQCLIHASGALSCRGWDDRGQLGTGLPTIAKEPIRVPVDDVVELRSGHIVSCALCRDRTLICWGWSPRSELERATAVLDAGEEVSCWLDGERMTCHEATQERTWKRTSAALGSVGAAARSFAWLDDTLCTLDKVGALVCSVGDVSGEPEWKRVASGGAVAQLASTADTFVVRRVNGRVTVMAPTLDEVVLVPSLGKATRIAAGGERACAIVAPGGEVWCWDVEVSDEGRPGVGTPTKVEGVRGATALATSSTHGCALVAGEVWCWGRNFYGQLGDGSASSFDEVRAPVRAKLPGKALQLGVGHVSACALVEGGQVWCWGSDEEGQLGQGRIGYSYTYVPVDGVGPRKN